MKKLSQFLLMGAAALMASCDPQIAEDITLPDSPEAAFSVQTVADNPNKVVFTATSPDAFLFSWDFGNGMTSNKQVDTVYYAFKGDYTVTLVASGKGGEGKLTRTVTVEQSDPAICEDAVLRILTGGCDAANGKTWVMDRNTYAHMGVGPKEADTPIWWAAQPNEKANEGCLYDDEMTFKLRNYEFIPENKGATYFNAGAVNAALGKPNPAADQCYDFTNPQANYAIVKRGDKTFISLTNKAFFSYYEGAHEYEILSISDDLLHVRSEVSYGYWYYRFIPKDKAALPPAPVAEFSFSVSPTNSLQVAFTNSTPNASSFTWDFGDGNTSTDQNPTHTYAAGGTYQVKLTAVGDGGTDDITKEVVVSDAPFDLAVFLNGGGSRSWKLAPIAGAMAVGPSQGSTEWWSLPSSELDIRSCQLDDEYIFSSDGKYEYKANGEGWKQHELFKDFGNAGCIDESTDWLNKFDVVVNEWKSSNTHTYTLADGVITVTGKGAFIVLPDAGTDKVTHVPQDFSTYTVIKTGLGTTTDTLWISGKGGGSENAADTDRPGFWTFILISNK